MKSVKEKTPVILLAIQTPVMSDTDVQRSLQELSLLIADLDMQAQEAFIQKRMNRTAASYFGEGKLKEIAMLTGGSGILAKGPTKVELVDSKWKVVIDDEVSAAQQRNLQSALGVEVIDRVSVILQIFEKRARSREAKLQVELAMLEYQLPRVKDDHSIGDKEGGGGRASRGHSNVELAKQRIRQRIASLKRELERLQPEKLNSYDYTVALIGYTNSGKSSIMRALTKDDIYVEDKLFATLGTTCRKMQPPAVPPIYLTDTVGFIERLPHELIASFHSTLAEARQAWLLLHIVDISDQAWQNHVQVSTKLLQDIRLDSKPSLLVFNKIDKISEDERKEIEQEYPHAIFVSALSKADMNRLRNKLLAIQSQELIECQLEVDLDGYQLLTTEFRHSVIVLRETYGETVQVVVRSNAKSIRQLKARLAKNCSLIAESG